MPFESEMVERGQEFKLGDLHVHLPTPEDLIIMKAIATQAWIKLLSIGYENFGIYLAYLRAAREEWKRDYGTDTSDISWGEADHSGS